MIDSKYVRASGLAVLTIAAMAISVATGQAETPSFVAPPRTIADISAILEQEKPDPQRFAKLQADANAQPPAGADRQALARFLYGRADARSTLGRVREAISDLQAALEHARAEHMDAFAVRIQSLLGFVYGWAGEQQHSLDVWRAIERDTRNEPLAPIRYNALRWIGINLIQLGDLEQAARSMQANEAAIAEARKNPNWPNDPARTQAEAHVAFGNAALAEARGQFRAAADGYHRAEEGYRASLANLAKIPNPPLRSGVEQGSEWMVARAARALAQDGRLAEAEVEARRALTNWLKLGGKYNLNTARIIASFAMTLVQQGRYAEAQTLTRNVIEIYQALGAERDSQVYAGCLNQLAGILALQGRWTEAAQTYRLLDESTKTWDAGRKDDFALDVTRIFTLYNVNDVAGGISAAKRLVARQAGHYGEQHQETALARGMLAMGSFRAGDDVTALREFRAATPILVGSRDVQAEEDDAVGAATREQRVKSVIESYIALLARAGGDGFVEALQLAEGIRGQSVQKALAASAARAVASNPALADLARREQDLGKQVSAQLGLLSNTLARPPEQRNDRAINDLRAGIDHLRRERVAAQREITQKFPDYAALIGPQPPRVEEIRSVLKPDEAFLSFYLGQETSYVWAVPKRGAMAFAMIPLSAAEIEKKITSLRAALEPNASTIDEIPPFDLALAHELYTLLLKPVEAGWRPAKNLLVATNGALGLLPLGLLPTASAEIKANAEPLFASYRDVPWLARSHAVTLVPSASALRTLRHLPPGSNERERLIGFGDPLFNAEQAAEAEHQQAPMQLAVATTMRGLPLKRRAAPQTEGVDRVELASLPRLPDTADELKSVALALQADPSKVLHLGKDANEATVKNTDLSHYKIIVFATHGLVPGELNGLHQPALALTAPDVAGVSGDGLLTMDKILALKLDADWVVLSACNTGAGAGAGAEAASGLGRAFFYAGTRAILVTNWSVHSQSARELVTDLFRRQAADAKISRGEALRQAMMGVLDNHAFTDENGKVLFTYGHPLFWAPYMIIGDGG